MPNHDRRSTAPESPVTYNAYSMDGVEVKVRTEPSGKGDRPTVEITRTTENPDGTKDRQSFVIDYERLADVVELLAPIVRQVGEREKAEERNTERAASDTLNPTESVPVLQHWTVVTVDKTLDSGAIVRVKRTFNDPTEAELFAFKEDRRAMLSEPLETEFKPGEKLVVADTESSPKLKRLIRDMRVFEKDYIQRKGHHPRVKWTPKSRPQNPNFLLWSRPSLAHPEPLPVS